MSDQPAISPEVQELRDEQEAERAYTTAMQAATVRAHNAAAFHIESKAHALNALAWLIAVAMIVGAAYVVTEVIL